MKWLKRFLVLVAILILVLVGSIAFVVLGIDPNSYKPEIEKLARNNDIELAIEGDLSWSFYPNLAVQAGHTRLSGNQLPGSKSAGIPNIEFNQADFVLDWSALLSRTVRLRAIAIDGAVIDIKSVEEASNVAALPGAAAATHTPDSQSTTSAATTKLPFELAIDELSLTNSRITLISQGNPDQVLEQLSFNSKELNIEGKAFPIQLMFSTQLPDDDNAVDVAFNAQLQLQLEQQQIQLADAELKVNGIKQLPATLTFNANYQGQQGLLAITQLSGKLGSAAITGEITASQLETTPSATGRLSIQNLQLSELPFDAPSGFKAVDFQTQFTASEENIELTQLKIALDKFNIGGQLTLKLTGPRQLEMTLVGDDLVLPEASETDSTPTDNNQAMLLTPILAPLALLEGGKGHIELNLNSVTSDNVRVEQLHLNLFSNGKVLQIADLSGSVFKGRFQLETRLDLTTKVPQVKFSKHLENIDIYSALTTLSAQSDIRGQLSMDFSGTSYGDTQESLMANINGTGTFNVSNPQVDNINIEKGYCEMAALVESRSLTNKVWPTYTQLNNLKGNILWRDQKILLPSFTTGLGNLAVSGNGTINLVDESYNMLITANLQGDQTSENGCPIKSKSIRNRDIPLRCTGSFAENGEGKCLPDKQFINQLLQDKIKEKLFDKFLKSDSDTTTEDGQTTEEESSETQATEQPKDIKEQVIDSLLKGIFQ